MIIRPAAGLGLLVALTLSACAPGTGNPEAGPSSAPWTWVETFDTLDPARWQVEFSTYGDPESQHCYHPDNVAVVDGALHLEARAGVTRCRHGKERPYSSGMVRTLGLVDWSHGEFEVDARFPAGAGLWPALWLSPTTQQFGPWPRSGEIDIAEALGHEPDRTVCSVHFWSTAEDRHDKSVGSITSPDADGLRTYGLRWGPDELVWTVDGQECHRAQVAELGQDGVFDQPFHLKINLAVGGAWPGRPDPAAFPATLVVEEIRVRSTSG